MQNISPDARGGSLGKKTVDWRALLATDDDKTLLVLRVVFAAVMWPHGAQHALGWFGGYGFSGTYGWMTSTVGVSPPLAVLAIATELIAPLFLLVGLGGRAAAAGRPRRNSRTVRPPSASAMPGRPGSRATTRSSSW